MGPANETYTEHRDKCYNCGAVDLGMRKTTRCMRGRKLRQRIAALEARMAKWKFKVTAKDLVTFRQMGIIV